MGRAKLIAAALGLVFVVGCGGSSDDGTTAVAAMSKKIYIKHADAICLGSERERQKSLNAIIAKREKETGKSLNAAEIGEVTIEAALPSVRRMIGELEDLGLPDRGKRQAEEIISSLKHGVEETEANPAGAASSSGFAAAARKSEAFGLTKCLL